MSKNNASNYIPHNEFLVRQKEEILKRNDKKKINDLPEHIKKFVEAITYIQINGSGDGSLQILDNLLNIEKKEIEIGIERAANPFSIMEQRKITFGEANAYLIGYVEGLKKIRDLRIDALESYKKHLKLIEQGESSED